MRLCLLGSLTLLMLVSSCASPQQHAGQTATLAPCPDAQDLKARAEQLWKARAAEDWAEAFLFETPAEREQMVEAEFIEWHKQNEPFVIHEYQIQRAQTEQELGWVEVDYRSSVRKYPKLPPRDAKRWEKWQVVAGEWYPISGREQERYPEAPARRNGAEEQRLRERFEESWQARHEGEWQRLGQFVDPRDREEDPDQQAAEAKSLYKYLSCDLHWVEVVGNRGRVRVTYEVKLDDPSMTKRLPTLARMTERWIKYEKEWYLDQIPNR